MQKGATTMKKCKVITLKYAAIGFACLVIAMATTRALDLPEIAPAVVGAVMLSLLVASTEETRKA